MRRIASLRRSWPFTGLRTPVEDDIDVYLIRPGAETFERPIDGGPEDWTLGEPPRRVSYVTASQIVAFPSQGGTQGQLTYIDRGRGVLVGVPLGFGVLQVVSDAELKKLIAAKRR